MGPRSSSSECLKRCCMLQRADIGFRRIVASIDFGWLADCPSGTLRCNDPGLARCGERSC
eukprot:10870999-Alexandrium_andersonii.AAC.1